MRKRGECGIHELPKHFLNARFEIKLKSDVHFSELVTALDIWKNVFKIAIRSLFSAQRHSSCVFEL